MAIQKIAVASSLLQFPESAVQRFTIPKTFRQAILDGWKVVSDDSRQSQNEKRREGIMVLGKGVQRLAVTYIGTLKGFQFSIPKVLQ